MNAKGDVTTLLRAIHFAAEKHRDHRRKGEIAAPYINHPLAVANRLAEAGLEHDTELLMAAVLHDVVEDTETTPEELRALFGERVAAIVMEVSDDKSMKETERKEHAVRCIAGKSEAARLVKLTDLIANIYDVIHHPPDWGIDRKQRYLDWGERLVVEIKGTHPELEKEFAEILAEGRSSLKEP